MATENHARRPRARHPARRWTCAGCRVAAALPARTPGFRMRNPTGLPCPGRVPQAFHLPYERRVHWGPGSSSLCPGTTAGAAAHRSPTDGPQVASTEAPGFGRTRGEGTVSPPQHHPHPPPGESPTSGQQRATQGHGSAPATAGGLQGHGGFRDGTNCVPAERGAFLKANIDQPERRGPKCTQFHHPVLPGKRTVGRQAGGDTDEEGTRGGG